MRSLFLIACEAILECGLALWGQEAREVVYPGTQRRHIERSGSRHKPRCERRKQERSDQNLTSGGVSVPGRASKLGRTCAPSRKRAVRFVGKERTRALYWATASM